MKLLLSREMTVRPAGAEAFTPGVLYVDGLRFCFTCEDEDRHLERVGIASKIYGRTAIPRGRYRVEVSWSHHFGKELPRILAVQGFDGVLLHGGNRAEDSLGCILLGKVRTTTGIAQCADSVKRLTAMIQACQDKAIPEEVWLVVE